MGIENFKGRCEIFNKTNIELETKIAEKIKIIEQNRDKKALVKIKDSQDEYLFGVIIPKNTRYFGLESIKEDEKVSCPPLIEYKELSDLIVCSD